MPDLQIWKFALRPGRPLVMPGRPAILSVGQQEGAPFLWALVSPDDPPQPRYLLIIGTGHDATAARGRAYIGSIVGVEGNLVLHVFDEESPF
jgi:hypothetical protein